MQSENSLYLEIVKKIVPPILQQYFEISSISESNETVTIYLEEKEALIPKSLHGKHVVKDGFRNPIELQSHPLGDNQLYFNIKRRKWKEQGLSGKSYSNEYELHRPGMKATIEFGNFLKETLGCGTSEFDKLWTIPKDYGLNAT